MNAASDMPRGDPVAEGFESVARPAPFKSSVFSTVGCDEAEARALFSELMHGLADVGAFAPGFFARSFSYDLAPITLDGFEGGGFQWDRLPERIARDGIDHYTVMLFLDRTELGYYDEWSLVAAPDEIVIAPWDHPTRCDVGYEKFLSISIPRALIDRRLGRRLARTRLAPDEAGLLADHIRSLHRRIGALRTEDVPRIVAMTVELIALSVGRDRAGPPAGPRPDPAATRARSFIEANYADPTLDAAAVARGIGVSRRTLYRLMAPEGGVAAHLLRTRLQQASAALAAPDGPRRISGIAFDCGFRSVAAFSRSFRRFHGVPPRDWRSR